MQTLQHSLKLKKIYISQATILDDNYVLDFLVHFSTICKETAKRYL